ncbi:unnamed protein product [Polarella glacialis]|uniref:EF-hand domain-containing protein n=1 Tax=Polarella glacialis TaxID=89957 RepID=A0A813GSI5_POLGL|nr:unnamed protein product [Polarella glacialis]
MDQTAVARSAVERLRAWLVREYKSVSRALEIFDLDADGTLSAAELGRAAAQAGVDALDVFALLGSLGLGGAGATARVEVLAQRLEGRLPDATAHASAVVSGSVPLGTGPFLAAATALDTTGGAPRMLQVALEASKLHKTMKSELLRLLEVVPPEGIPLSPELREQDALTWLATAPWELVLEVVDPMGSSLLLLASRLGLERVCQRLLALGAGLLTKEQLASYVNKPNDMGWTPLLLTAQSGYVRICRHLLEALADANLPTAGTRLTPLMLAASNGHAETVQLLLDMGWTRPWVSRADAWRTSVDGRTALDFVRYRLQAQRQLADDQGFAGQLQSSNVLDMYAVRKPQLVELPGAYAEIEKALLALTKGSTALGELHQDLLLGYVKPTP